MLIAAAHRAVAIGLPLNRWITIHFSKMGLTDADGAAATGAYLKLLSDHIRAKGGRTAWAYARENDVRGKKKGSHVHILAHVPSGIDLGRMHKRWCRRIGRRPYRGGMIHTERVAGAANAWRTSPDHYWVNLWTVLGYALKGVNEQTARALGLEQWNKGGTITGKRCGRSQNLRPAASDRLMGATAL
jgi:hypothetical protein